MFSDRGRLARHVTLKTIMNTRIEETPIIDHMIHMNKLFNKMKILEFKSMVRLMLT